MKLLGSLTSPYVRKVRILALEKGIDLPLEVVDPHTPGSPVPIHNPLGKVPVLLRDGESSLFDSPVITAYLDSLKEPRWYPADSSHRLEVLRMEALADGILDATVTRLLESRREPALRSAAVMEREEARIARAITFAEAELGRGRFGDAGAPNMADLALAAALEYVDFRYPHDWRVRHAPLTAWFHAYRDRAAFTETLPPGFERPGLV